MNYGYDPSPQLARSLRDRTGPFGNAYGMWNQGVGEDAGWAFPVSFAFAIGSANSYTHHSANRSTDHPTDHPTDDRSADRSADNSTYTHGLCPWAVL